MQVRALSKTGAVVSLSVLLVVMMLGSSVSEKIAVTSEKSTITVTESQKPAPSKKPGVIVSSKSKKKRTATPFLAATVIKPTASVLTAVNNKDITPHHQELADSVLKALPPHCRTYLKNFYVQYTNVKQRGLGGKTTIIIDGTAPDAEFAALLIHECGHVTHSNMLGSLSAGESAYRDGKEAFYNDSPMVEFFGISWMSENIKKQNVKDADFVSGYAKSDAFEDFAETFAMYILHRTAFAERAQTNPAIAAKLAWMNKYVPSNGMGTDAYSWDKKVPWDVTKLAFSF